MPKLLLNNSNTTFKRHGTTANWGTQFQLERADNLLQTEATEAKQNRGDGGEAKQPDNTLIVTTLSGKFIVPPYNQSIQLKGNGDICLSVLLGSSRSGYHLSNPPPILLVQLQLGEDIKW